MGLSPERSLTIRQMDSRRERPRAPARPMHRAGARLRPFISRFISRLRAWPCTPVNPPEAGSKNVTKPATSCQRSDGAAWVPDGEDRSANRLLRSRSDVRRSVSRGSMDPVAWAPSKTATAKSVSCSLCQADLLLHAGDVSGIWTAGALGDEPSLPSGLRAMSQNVTVLGRSVFSVPAAHALIDVPLALTIRRLAPGPAMLPL
jgi:hypothetical protein